MRGRNFDDKDNYDKLEILSYNSSCNIAATYEIMRGNPYPRNMPLPEDIKSAKKRIRPGVWTTTIDNLLRNHNEVELSDEEESRLKGKLDCETVDRNKIQQLEQLLRKEIKYSYNNGRADNLRDIIRQI